MLCCHILACAALAEFPYLLYQIKGDADLDKAPERISIYSQNPDPAVKCAKILRIEHLKNNKYLKVFEISFTAAFKTQFNYLIDKYKEGYKTGVYLHKTAQKIYPEIWIVLTPNSSDMLVFQYDGKSYKRIMVKD